MLYLLTYHYNLLFAKYFFVCCQDIFYSCLNLWFVSASGLAGNPSDIGLEQVILVLMLSLKD